MGKGDQRRHVDFNVVFQGALVAGEQHGQCDSNEEKDGGKRYGRDQFQGEGAWPWRVAELTDLWWLCQEGRG